ncbi:hypothetical protein BHU72_13795 [Desulfuribacillus stibiiarsenatis]|uniref:UVR domain-containing protein n=1 Tax=Desulfuribacillus stibiiarsenatis TaxID=1390249 RepID=A0A1E5L8E2_9FIRM|nr:UvrB/UvrC motif-containing protein [Desulfuribacillus stibiiarsenatis]OEH86294.1 hypothetical protein BHU72_13795 [Desulfuribacillus stibiiarsenatis]
MDCQECNRRPATVHLTKIINNQKTESHLCEQCAQQKGEFSQGFSFHELLSGLLSSDINKAPTQEHSQCDTCGMTFQQFYKVGKLGCADCYKCFNNQLDHILRKVQGNLTHTGKIPSRMGEEILMKRKVNELRHTLQRKVYEEKFEDAAEIRDQIKALETKLQA